MRRTTRIATVGSALALGFGALGVTVVAPASADAVWHQSVGRGTAEQACPECSAADLETGWSSWGATWEEWVNDGTGGWACTRSITWARSGGGALGDLPGGSSGYPEARSQCETAGGAFTVVDDGFRLYRCDFVPDMAGDWNAFEVEARAICLDSGGDSAEISNRESFTCLTLD